MRQDQSNFFSPFYFFFVFILQSIFKLCVFSSSCFLLRSNVIDMWVSWVEVDHGIWKFTNFITILDGLQAWSFIIFFLLCIFLDLILVLVLLYWVCLLLLVWLYAFTCLVVCFCWFVCFQIRNAKTVMITNEKQAFLQSLWSRFSKRWKLTAWYTERCRRKEKEGSAMSDKYWVLTN